MSRFVEFFEDDRQQLSMTRLVMFLSFVPATYVVVKGMSPDALCWYLSAYAAAYGAGKLSDVFSNKKGDG